MDLIPSFQVDHNRIVPGIYESRLDTLGSEFATTFDIRMKKPNGGDYLSNGALHTFEHLFATYVRNGRFSDSVIYVGPMGCRTGFYFILRDSVKPQEAIDLVKESFKFIADFTGEIPGAKRRECGNYLEHDLGGAKNTAEDMLFVLKNWKEEDLKYNGNNG